MPYVSVDEFKFGLSNIRKELGPIILSVRAKIIPTWARTKGNNYVDRVHKIVVFNGIIGIDYGAGVNRALEKQGKKADFVPQRHSWAEFLEDCFLIYPDDPSRVYLRFKENSRREWFFVDGDPATDEQLRELTPFLRVSKDKNGYKYRNIMVDHVLAIRWRQELIVVDHEMEEEEDERYIPVLV